MKWLLIRGLCVLLAIGIFSLMPALLLYYLGYSSIHSWNRDAVATTCQVINYTIVQHNCSYECNCYDICVKGCTTYCDTCYSTCYDSDIDVSYNTSNGTMFSQIIVYGNQGNPNVTINETLTHYPMNTTFTCYYESSNPSDVRLSYDTDTVYLAFFIVFIVLGGLGLLLWIGLEIGFHLHRLNRGAEHS
jgi:hypothetical protein